MKKLVVLSLLIFGLNQTSKSQNSLEVTIDPNLCLSEFTTHYTDNAYEAYTLGCDDTNYDIGSKEIEYFTINGVDCLIGTDTNILVNGGKRAVATPQASGDTKKWTLLVHLAADNN